MIVTTENRKKIDLSCGIDLSIPLTKEDKNPIAWHVPPPRFEPVQTEDWTGLVKKGGAVNFRNIFFNPHGHGTHTECLGHITPEIHSINQTMNRYFFNAVVISVQPQKIAEDLVVLPKMLHVLQKYTEIEALIIRTLPNEGEKKSRNYSGKNPPYLDIDCLAIMDQLKVQHLLVDLPSVDPEEDGGEVAFHHGFWGVPHHPRWDRTITEFIYVPNSVKDGLYFLNLQVAPFENDAAPSRPIIYSFL